MLLQELKNYIFYLLVINRGFKRKNILSSKKKNFPLSLHDAPITPTREYVDILLHHLYACARKSFGFNHAPSRNDCESSFIVSRQELKNDILGFFHAQKYLFQRHSSHFSVCCAQLSLVRMSIFEDTPK